MKVELHHSSELFAVAEYAYSSSVEATRLVFTAGACPLNLQGQVPTGSFAEQAALCMENLQIALRAAGSDLASVLKTTVYVASDQRNDLVAAWQEVRAVMAEHDAPSTLLGVAVLGYPGQLVEVEAVAVAKA